MSLMTLNNSKNNIPDPEWVTQDLVDFETSKDFLKMVKRKLLAVFTSF
jgi:hypothetical protein